jgi:hypothetical protein
MSLFSHIFQQVFGEEKNMAKTNVHVGPIRRFVLASSKDRFIPVDEFVSLYKHTHTIYS